MVRSVDDDFDALRGYIDSYDLAGLLKSADAKNFVKAGHRIYLSLLYLWAEAILHAAKGQLILDGKALVEAAPEVAHLREAVSDVGAGLFCCIQGAYKAGHMCLRSSIENFLRFISSPYNVDALKTTSVYELFAIAGTTAPFSGERKAYLDVLRNSYVQLCLYTHSGSLRHMSGVHALSHFPAFDIDGFKTWIMHANHVTTAIASALVLEVPNLFLRAHFKSKEVLELIIPQNVRLVILGRI